MVYIIVACIKLLFKSLRFLNKSFWKVGRVHQADINMGTLHYIFHFMISWRIKSIK